MYSLEILLMSIAASAAVAALITYWFNSSSATTKQALKTESELSETREAFDAYRKEVLEEFNETASKFKTLNTSYVDLHQQLARSANTLCGEAAAITLLEAPITQTTSHVDVDVDVDEATTTIDPVEVEVEVDFESSTTSAEETSETTENDDISSQKQIKS